MMHISMDVKDLVAALIEAQKQIKQPKKTCVNPHFKSKFADLEACMDCLREPLAANGLAVPQLVIGDQLVTTLVHVSGQCISSTYPLINPAGTPQGMGSAITYARRYALCAMFNIVAEPDDDGNAASTNASKEAAAARAAFLKKVQPAKAAPGEAPTEKPASDGA